MIQDSKELLQKLEGCEARVKALETETLFIGERLVQKEFENAESLKKLRIAETELAIYREVDSISLETLDIRLMLDRMMDIVIKTMESEAGTLYRLDDTGDLVFEIVKGPVAEELKGKRMKVCDGIAGWIARTGMPYAANEVAYDPLWNKEFGDKAHYTPEDMLGVPLKTKRGVIGVIQVLNKKEGKPFEKKDFTILTALSLRISTILEKATLFLDLDKSVKQFTTLAEVSTFVNSTLDQKIVKKMTMEVITKLMNAEVGSLLLVDDEKDELYFEVALGDKEDMVKEIRLKIGEGIAGWVALHGEPLLIPDVSKDPRFYKSADEKTDFVTRNMICVPVKVKDKIIGVLQAINRFEGAFTEDDLKLFQIFSNQVAIALDNAWLHAEMSKTLEKFQSLYNNAVEGIFQITTAGRLIAANPSFAKLLGYDSPDDAVLSITDIGGKHYVRPDDYNDFSRIIRETGRVVGFETEVHRKGGGRRWISISGHTVIDGNGAAALYEGSILDVTERREKEEAKMQREIAEMKGRFIRETFGRYLSDEVVETILETPAGLQLGGAKRTVTIMMTDLRGFTSLGEQLPAEDVVSMINIYLEVMTEIIFKYNGTIDEFIGDAILVIFGAPVKRDDDAARAVACALEMQAAMKEVNRRNMETGYPDVKMGIGINTGSVVVGNIGSKRRIKYGVVGANVNLTSRIESYTVGGQILVSESTVSACGDILRIDGQMEVMPKGAKDPITIYEVGGIGGDFNVSLSEKKEIYLLELIKPLSIRFKIIDGKHVSEDAHEGVFVRINSDLADIRSDMIPEKLTNLKITLLDKQGEGIASDIYAKVMEKSMMVSSSGFRVHFTSIPRDAMVFMETIMGEIVG